MQQWIILNIPKTITTTILKAYFHFHVITEANQKHIIIKKYKCTFKRNQEDKNKEENTNVL